MQLNRSFVFCLLLVSIAVFLFAQQAKPTEVPGCSKMVSLKGGELLLTGPGDPSLGVSVTSFLTAPRYTITKVSGDDPPNTGIGTLCNAGTGGCTPDQISSSLQSSFGIIGFPPNGSMFVNGQQFGMWGFPGFLATTISSSVDVDGNLIVSGSAVGYTGFYECDLSGSCMSIPDEVCFDFGKSSWQYSGQFVPDTDPGSIGTYDFSFIDITSKHRVNLPASGTY